MKIFGSPAYSFVDNEKLEPSLRKCVFLSFKSSIKRYKLWCLKTSKVLISRGVIFNESEMLRDLRSIDSCEVN